MERDLELACHRIACVFAVVCFLLAHAVPVAATEGGLDPTFASVGKEVFEGSYFSYPSPQGIFPKQVVEQSDGRLIVVGNLYTGPFGSAGALLRIGVDGVVDASYGVGGYAFPSAPPGLGSWGFSNAVLTGNGNLLTLAGAGAFGSGEYYLYRFLPSGSVDTTFGTGGFVDISPGHPGITHACRGYPMKLMRTGGGKFLILCTDTSVTAPGSVVSRLLRLNADGSVDITFGSNGTIDFPGHAKIARIADVIELADGSFVGTGPRYSAPGGMLVQKIASDGTPDAGFGTNGTAETPYTIFGNDQAYRLVSNGSKFVVAGYGGTGVLGNFTANPKVTYPILAVQINGDGTLDTSFGNGGRVLAGAPANADKSFASSIYIFDYFGALYRQSDGKLLIGSVAFRAEQPAATQNPGYNTLVLRLLENGTLDTNFGNGGYWYDRINLYAQPDEYVYGYETSYTSIIQQDGKLLIAGQAQYSNDINGAGTEREYPLFLFRILTGDGTPPLAARTFVASTGNDVNPCTAASPCRTLSAALALTSQGGDIVILDSAGFGPLVLDRPVTITAPPGVYAGISVSSGTGITVNPGAGKVTLRGLTINGLGGTIGVDFQSGDALYIEDCAIDGFTNAGVAAVASKIADVFIRDTVLRNNGVGAIFGTSTIAAATLSTHFERSRFTGNVTAGISITGGNSTTVIDNTLLDGGLYGLVLNPTLTSAIAKADVRGGAASNASGSGILVGGTAATTATVALSSVQVTENGIGLETLASGIAWVTNTTIGRNTIGVATPAGSAVSLGDNRLTGNITDGAFSSTVSKH